MSEPFGEAPDGDPVRRHEVAGGERLRIAVTDLGAALVSVELAGADGAWTDVILGFDSAQSYASATNPYLGATVGRVANRIADASFVLGGQRYRLAANEPPHHLHGGSRRSFDKVVWELVDLRADAVSFRYVSPAGEEGYPATVEAFATYQVTDRDLRVTYRASTDAPTPLNLTNHAYWNLRGAGGGDVLDHELMVDAEAYTPTDDELIPTGEIAPVVDTPLDLRARARIGERVEALRSSAAGGLDHNYVLADRTGARHSPAAQLTEPSSGRRLELFTDQPGLQVYSGNQLEPPLIGRAGQRYGRHAGLCLEAQHFPDAVNQPSFPSIVVEPGIDYEHTTTFRLTSP